MSTAPKKKSNLARDWRGPQQTITKKKKHSSFKDKMDKAAARKRIQEMERILEAEAQAKRDIRGAALAKKRKRIEDIDNAALKALKTANQKKIARVTKRQLKKIHNTRKFDDF
eukprot:gnl/Dysnectes_brevis/269_a300_8191.p1 GENE.gnl/Dysnectes_brevis/269_a300_8191~~gnl/Dysnectes_brevis/269_a300_8191.p1  ORF type:complete len:113 (+),score=19.32 gnl/Dysnectes_brevis/269_a300_8191:73-411(+)